MIRAVTPAVVLTLAALLVAAGPAPAERECATADDPYTLRVFHVVPPEAAERDPDRIPRALAGAADIIAEASQSRRAPRWECTVREVSADGADGRSVREAIRASGYGAPRQLAFIDAAGPVCGRANQPLRDPLAATPHTALLYASCPSGTGWDSGTVAHELLHLLGGVHPDSPVSDGAGHCDTGADLLCPHEAGTCLGLPVDCTGLGYFALDPPEDSWLATSGWNIADSPYLGAPAPEPEPAAEPAAEPAEPATEPERDPIGPGPERATFPDTADHEHAEAIAELADAGVIRGYPDGRYRPEQPVKRGQLAAIIARILDDLLAE